MAKSLREVITGKSEDGLADYLENFTKYTPEAIKAAVDEMKRRGRKFSEEELNDIDLKIENRTNAENEEDTLFASDSWKKNVVTDPDAPLLYSKGAVRAFSVVFSTIFGAVLLSCNIKDNRRKSIVIGFGVLYTASTMVIVNFIPSNTFWILLLNSAGGLGLTSTFWDKFVGKQTKYRSKPVWKPLVISIMITIPIILAVIYS